MEKETEATRLWGAWGGRRVKGLRKTKHNNIIPSTIPLVLISYSLVHQRSNTRKIKPGCQGHRFQLMMLAVVPFPRARSHRTGPLAQSVFPSPISSSSIPDFPLPSPASRSFRRPRFGAPLRGASLVLFGILLTRRLLRLLLCHTRRHNSRMLRASKSLNSLAKARRRLLRRKQGLLLVRTLWYAFSRHPARVVMGFRPGGASCSVSHGAGSYVSREMYPGLAGMLFCSPSFLLSLYPSLPLSLSPSLPLPLWEQCPLVRRARGRGMGYQFRIQRACLLYLWVASADAS